jgi:hypothetical protein
MGDGVTDYLPYDLGGLDIGAIASPGPFIMAWRILLVTGFRTIPDVRQGPADDKLMA